MRDTLGDRSQLLIGIDRSKDVDRLVAAYDDTQGVTARFNLNLLDRINRELGGNVPSGRFRHVARWNAKWSRIEMHLEAIDDMVFTVSGTAVQMRKGETIHTENSHTYKQVKAGMLHTAGGVQPINLWSDQPEEFT